MAAKADTTSSAIDTVADDIGQAHDTIQYDEYPASVFALIDGTWYQITTHRINSEKMTRRLNGDNQ